MASLAGVGIKETLDLNAVNKSLSQSGANRFRPLQKADGAGVGVALLNMIMALAGLALLVISALGAAGQLSGVVVGGTMAGVMGGSFILNLLKACLGRDGKEMGQGVGGIIVAIALIIIGALTITGMIPPTTAGWVVCGMTIAMVGLACLLCTCLFSVGVAGKAGS